MQRPAGHVLVVDDDPLSRRLLAKNLENEGYRASVAPDGMTALAALAEDPPDVVLLDLVMPGIDGLEVLTRIKADDALRHIPVILISGSDDADTVVRCLEIGADDFLPKPFDPAILRARVSAGLARKELHDLERARVRQVFARFLPESLVDEVLARNDGEAIVAAESLTASVLFADLRGFTAFAEGRPVEEVIGALNRYQGLMTDTILDHRGTLVSYMGDGVMAAFGAPVASEDHADRAVAAAREMVVHQLAAFNGWIREEGLGDGFRMGVGINSGPVMSGSVGSSRRMDYAVIGDTTNTASRVEALTKTTDHPVLFSAATKDALHQMPDDAVPLGEFEVRGRRSAIELWGLDLGDRTTG